MADNYNLMESLGELQKLIQLMDDDASSLNVSQAITDYIAPILDSMVSEIEVNRQYAVQTNDRVSLALMMAEKTFLGDILTSIADHFSTVIDEIPEDTAADSTLGVAVSEIQDLLATWMSFDVSDLEDEDDDVEDEDSDVEDGDRELEEAYEEGIGFAAEALEDEDDEVEVVESELIVEGEVVNNAES